MTNKLVHVDVARIRSILIEYENGDEDIHICHVLVLIPTIIFVMPYSHSYLNY